MLVLSPQGLYCPAGDFHIDPLRPVKTVSTGACQSQFALIRETGAKKIFVTHGYTDILTRYLNETMQLA